MRRITIRKAPCDFKAENGSIIGATNCVKIGWQSLIDFALQLHKESQWDAIGKPIKFIIHPRKSEYVCKRKPSSSTWPTAKLNGTQKVYEYEQQDTHNYVHTRTYTICIRRRTWKTGIVIQIVAKSQLYLWAPRNSSCHLITCKPGHVLEGVALREMNFISNRKTGILDNKFRLIVPDVLQVFGL